MEVTTSQPVSTLHIWKQQYITVLTFCSIFGDEVMCRVNMSNIKRKLLIYLEEEPWVEIIKMWKCINQMSGCKLGNLVRTIDPSVKPVWLEFEDPDWCTLKHLRGGSCRLNLDLIGRFATVVIYPFLFACLCQEMPWDSCKKMWLGARIFYKTPNPPHLAHPRMYYNGLIQVYFVVVFILFLYCTLHQFGTLPSAIND